MRSTFRALRNKNFAALLFGQTLSRIGDFLFQIALAWWVLEKTGSATAMGTVLFFSTLPMVVFVLVGGVVVDRMRRGLLLFMSDMARCFIMVVGAWLAFTDQLVLWQIYVIAILFGFADAFFLPAYNALIQQMVAEEDLPSANSINSLSMQFGRVAGPAIGGLIVGFGGTAVAFGFNALSFFIGALTVASLLNLPAPASTDPGRIHPQAVQGRPARWIRHDLFNARFMGGDPCFCVYEYYACRSIQHRHAFPRPAGIGRR